MTVSKKERALVKVKEREFKVEIVPEGERALVRVKEREFKVEMVPEREPERW